MKRFPKRRTDIKENKQSILNVHQRERERHTDRQTEKQTDTGGNERTRRPAERRTKD